MRISRLSTLDLPFRLLLLAASLLLSACAHQRLPAPDLTATVTATRVAITRAKAKAASIHPKDAATSAAVADLRQQLTDVGVSFDALTAKVQWYETDWARLSTENTSLKSTVEARDAVIAKQASALHQTAKERDFYPILIAFGLGWVALRRLTPLLAETLGVIPYVGPFLVLAAPEVAFVLGAAGGFFGARVLAVWGSRFLP